MRSVLYLRMSTDRQETSVRDQRTELRKYAKARGYQIVGEYVDEGISGDATEKRAAFQAMIRDCASKRFGLILCWDQDRFGRFDPVEGGYWIKPIRDAGVQLETIAQGRIDWSDFASRLVWTVTQEAKHAYLRTLSKDCVRGLAAAVDNGVYPGMAPFGYRKRDKRLVLGPTEEVETVRELFRLRLTGMGARTIAARLATDGRPAPGKGQWSQGQVRSILARYTYVGHTIYGKVKRGKYNSLEAAKTKRNTHPPIIDDATWRKAQQPTKQGTVSYRGGRIVGSLCGLIYCGTCGAKMYRFKRRHDYGYVCGTYHQGKGCAFGNIPDAKILPILGAEIREAFGSDVETIAGVIAAKLASRKPTKARENALRQISSLQTKIDRAVKRLAAVDDETFATLNATIKHLRAEKSKLESRVDPADNWQPANPRDIAALIDRLPEMLLTADPQLVGPCLSRIVERIDVEFERLGKGTIRKFHRVSGVKIRFRW